MSIKVVELTSDKVMNAILSTSCPYNILEDGWNVFRFELFDVTWEVIAKCIALPVDPENLFAYGYSIRSAKIID